MQYRKLGNSGLIVSAVALGTMQFGTKMNMGSLDQKATNDMVKFALDSGINFIDTADVYSRGESETLLGNALKGIREEIVLATKVRLPMSDNFNRSGATRVNIMRGIESSLKRLQTDHIDLYQMHHIDRDTPWEEIWQAMDQLVRQGKVIYIGSSNFAGWHIVQANEAARARHFMGLVSEQCKYNLNHRMVELEVLPACEAYGLGVIPWSPLSSGLLGGVLKKINVGRRGGEDMQKSIASQRPKLEKYEALCDKVGEKPANIALAWLLNNPVVTAPIIGPRTLEQLNDVSRALDIELSVETLEKLDEIFPGPGGPAPEAFAW